MSDFAASLLSGAAEILRDAASALLIPALIFAALALIAKGRGAFAAARRAAGETRINLCIYFLDALLIGPPLVLFLAAMQRLFEAMSAQLVSPTSWKMLPAFVVGFLAILAGDFIGYWRHRLEHTRWLWPAHAVHHSDTEMTWLALLRFHPLSRLVTLLIDNGFLFLIGFPPYALLVNNVVRHYWGYVIHADLPWTFGPFAPVIVSPVMHRWHHALDPAAHNTNYATIFSLYDRMFGTYRVPARQPLALGVSHDMGKGVLAQLAYPLRSEAYANTGTNVHPAVTECETRFPALRNVSETAAS